MSRFVIQMALLAATANSVSALEVEAPPPPDEESPDTAAPETPVVVTPGEPDQEPVVEPDPVASEARMRFELGNSLYTQGRFADALVEFGRSYALSGEAQLLHNMYLCERDAGNTAEAAELLRRYLVDGREVENRPLLESRLEALDAQLAEEAAAQAAGNVAPVRPPPPPPPSRVGPVVLLATGGAALLAAGGLALHVGALNAELNDRCFGTRCAGHLTDDRQALRRRAVGVDALWAAGLAIGVIGVIWWLLSSPNEEPDEEPDETELDAELSCGLGGCALTGRF